MRINGHRAGTNFLGTDTREIDRRDARHSRRLRGAAVEGVGRDHAHAVLAPADGVVVTFYLGLVVNSELLNKGRFLFR